MRIKSKELAEKLGVSTATVSLVINNKPGISKNLRESLTERIVQMGYGEMIKSGDAPASKPASSKSGSRAKKTIVYAIYSLEDLGSDQSGFYTHVLEGCDLQARELGFNLQMVHIDSKCGCSLADCINLDECIGVVLQAYQVTDWIYNDLRKTGLPFIAVDRYNYSRNLSSVCVNNEDGMFFAIRHLYELGHKNIGYVGSGFDFNTVIERRRNYHQALREFNLVDRPEFRFLTKVEVAKTTRGSGIFRSLINQWSQMEELPTALVCENDILAVQVLKAVRKMGLKVPEDISIVGFDDRSMSQWCDPPLTTVRVHRHLMGRQAVQLLLNLIDMRKSGFKSLPYKVCVGIEFVPRESTASPKNEIIKINQLQLNMD
ncbi:MAG: LacI family DNA-binding transcriptional regulator [Clostridia bacterium]|nr:LacI family DNA-binding transcriptional regulator [Clostridia bacterium]